MLVAKKSNRRQIILMIIAVVFIGVAVYIFSRGPGEPEVPPPLIPGEAGITPSVIDLDTTIFGEERVTQLRDRSGESYTDQYVGTPTDKDTVLPPEEVYVFNPQVGKKLIIYWKNPDENNTVIIYRSQTSGKIGKMVADGISEETNYQDTGLENKNLYYYTVRSVNSGGKESENTNQVSGSPTDIFPPKSPTGVVIKDFFTGDKMEIMWVDPYDSDFDYVRIYRSQTSGKIGSLILDEKVDNSRFIDETVQEGIAYYYLLTALDESGNESEKSLLPVGGNPTPFE